MPICSMDELSVAAGAFRQKRILKFYVSCSRSVKFERTAFGTSVVLLDLAAGKCSGVRGFAECAWPHSDMHNPCLRK